MVIGKKRAAKLIAKWRCSPGTYDQEVYDYLESLRKNERRMCKWLKMKGKNAFVTECGNAPHLDNPLDRIKYCPYCRGRIKEIK